MAGIYVNDKGTWKLPKSIWVKSGAWRVCKNIYINNRGYWQPLIQTVDLTSSKQNFNLYKHVGSPTEPLSLIFNISSGVEIYSSGSTGGYRTTAFTVGNFPAGSTVIINNNGYISGGGGVGGSGETNSGYTPPSNGYPGGVGIEKGSSSSYDCTIVNTGTIAGGGGGGGGGVGEFSTGGQFNPSFYTNGNSGGQGAGITGASRTQGGSPMTTPTAGGTSVPNTRSGGFGGSLGSPGESNKATGASLRTGGAGGKAINTAGIEIAISGTIIGAVG